MLPDTLVRAALAAFHPDAPASAEEIADAQAWARAATERVLAAHERSNSVSEV
jgi:hypothetical protein